MRIVGIYSFNGGFEVIKDRFENELAEIEQILGSIRAHKYRTKKSKERTMPGKMLYNPAALNKAIEEKFLTRGWQKRKVPCEYPTTFYTGDYVPKKTTRGAFREIDFVKNYLGVEVQFGKYAFMVYNVCAKMTIFHNMGIINTGIETVPLKVLADEMSTGVSYFEQFVWDLEHRGVSNIDIPVLILGVIP